MCILLGAAGLRAAVEAAHALCLVLTKKSNFNALYTFFSDLRFSFNVK